jgi:hypothetical protein
LEFALEWTVCRYREKVLGRPQRDQRR